MNTAQQSIQCSWCGRHEDSVKVSGASSKEDARQQALKFFRNDETGCDDEGITIDDGRLITWSYDEPQPSDWRDYYVFWSVDANPVDQRDWWEK